ncbi:hypothetical protein [Pseudomonas sp. URMO17WK12:I12]|uniref:SGNH/GDSL hydrolase family protein n=1 Tax=Pseudomonas sp. URMO17WK12:I12 TaxID=1259797 RepID=UPI0012DDF6AD|nr:hypothetical protein [Pseudomonas sp. URMO17WK12:I12]
MDNRVSRARRKFLQILGLGVGAISVDAVARGNTSHGNAVPSNRVNIIEEGGIDDDASDNTSVFMKIFRNNPNGCVIEMPRSSHGVYFISGNNHFTDIGKFVLDPGVGVSVRFDAWECFLAGDGARTTAPLSIRYDSLRYTFTLGPEAYKSNVEKSFFMSPLLGEAEIPESLDASRFFNQTVNLTNGDLSFSTPVLASKDLVMFSSVPATGFNLTTTPVRPGHEIHGCFDTATFCGLVAAAVVTDEGWCIAYQHTAGGPIGIATKSGSQPVSFSKPIIYPMQERKEYFAKNATVGVRVHSAKMFSVVFNGLEVARVKNAGGNITYAGWAVGNQTAAGATSLVAPYRVIGKKSMGSSPLKIVVCGDSTTTDTVAGAWPGHMRRFLTGMSGVQIMELKNLAVAGDISSQQKDLLLATDIEGYNYCLIQLGINDIQISNYITAYVAEIEAMVSYCQSKGVTPIVGLPTYWYGRADALPYGNMGQDALQSEKGAPFRNYLMRRLADLGVQGTTLAIQDQGAVMADFLARSSNDPIVVDNIHPGAYARMVTGFAWAKALAGAISPKVSKDTPPKTVNANWLYKGFGSAAKPVYSIQGDHFSLSDCLSYSGLRLVDGSNIMAVPAAFATRWQKLIPVTWQKATGEIGGVVHILAGVDGSFKIFDSPYEGSYYINLSAISYQIAE